VASAQVSGCLAVAGCVPASVAVDDLLPHGVRFGAVELELGMDVGDRELKAADLGELGGIRDRRVEGVAECFVGMPNLPACRAEPPRRWARTRR
jgi:hypothetical protein